MMPAPRAMALLAAAIATAALPAACVAAESGPVVQNIKVFCAGRWPTDYEMQAYCIDQQVEAAIKVTQTVKDFPEDSEELRIVLRCLGKWQGPGETYDYEMVDYCAGNQLRAYRRLNQ